MSYDAGSAVAKYVLDISDATAKIAQLKAAFTGLQSTQPSVGGATPFAPISQDALKAETALQKLAQQQQKTTLATTQAARAAQQLATEEQKTAREAANTAAAQDRAAKSALSLAAAQEKAAKQSANGGLGPALPRTFAGFTPEGFNQALGAFGLAQFGPQIVGKIIGEGVQAGQEALALRETRNSLRAVSGDAKTYTTILQEAKNQQLLFGGSLQDITEGLSGFAVTARNTGAPLSQLIDLQKRLTLLNPAQGAQGGLIALNEALAGNITSLSRRFNIPKAALQELNDTTKPAAERLQVLDKFLASVGITSSAITSRVDAGAQAFRRLNQELDTAKLNAGDNLAQAFTAPAIGLSRLIGLINDNPQAIAEIRSLFNGSGGKIDQSNVDQAAREIAERKAAAQVDTTRASTSDRFGPKSIGATGGDVEQLHAAREALVELNLAGGQAADQADLLTQARKSGTITLDTYVRGLQVLNQEQQVSGDIEGLRAQRLDGLNAAQNAAVGKLQELINGTQKSADTSTVDAAQKDLQQAKTALVNAETKKAADAFLQLNPTMDSSSAYAAAVAQGLGIVTAQVIAFRIEANKTKQELGALATTDPNANLKAGLAALRSGSVTTANEISDANVRVLQREASDRAKAAADAAKLEDLKNQNRLIHATTTAAKIAELERQKAAESDPAKRQELQNRIDEERLSVAKSRTGELGKQQKLEESIFDSINKQKDAELSLEESIIRGRQEARKAAAEDKTAQRILDATAGRTDARSLDFRARAQDVIALNDVQRRIREQQEAEKTATAGGKIINGKIYQSKPGNGSIPAPADSTSANASGTSPAAPTGTQGSVLTVNVMIDGKAAWTGMAPFAWDDLMHGVQAVKVSKGA